MGERIDLRRSALIVVDVQNDFCHPDGTAARMGLDVSAVQSVVPNIVTLIELARAHDVPRIYLRGEHNHWFDTPTWVARGAAGRSIRAQVVPYVETGTWGADFFVVTPADDELVIVKHRYSGFAYTPLELALQTLGVDTVVLCGTSTHVCVEATARDAIMRGYRPVTVENCVASGQAPPPPGRSLGYRRVPRTSRHSRRRPLRVGSWARSEWVRHQAGIRARACIVVGDLHAEH